MTLINYTGVTDVKDWMGIASGDSADDVKLLAICGAVSRTIDEYCGRNFNTATSGTRYFTAEDAYRVYIDDVVSVSAVALDDGSGAYSTTLSATDYRAGPRNNAALSKPYTRLDSPAGAFSTLDEGIAVTGTFGWSSVPAPIAQAATMYAARLLRRKDAVFGIRGSAEMGTLEVAVRRDPDIFALLDPYRKGPLI